MSSVAMFFEAEKYFIVHWMHRICNAWINNRTSKHSFELRNEPHLLRYNDAILRSSPQMCITTFQYVLTTTFCQYSASHDKANMYRVLLKYCCSYYHEWNKLDTKLCHNTTNTIHDSTSRLNCFQ